MMSGMNGTCNYIDSMTLSSAFTGNYFGPFYTLISILAHTHPSFQQKPHVTSQKNELLSEYDFIVVGAGSAGSVLASRLSENPNWSVLLIEAGGEQKLGMKVPGLILNYFNQDVVDWNYKTGPEDNACLDDPEHKCYWIRGKVMGGCSAVNGMMYNRGNPLDYDDWPKDHRVNWTYADNEKYFLKSEDNQEIGTLVDGKYHGKGGLVKISRFPYQPEMAYDILKAGKEIGYNITNDLNGANPFGFAIAQSCNENGVRLTSVNSFIDPIRARSNLHILTNTLVTKVIIKNLKSKRRIVTKATGIEYLNENGKLSRIRVKKEVILSAGAIGSPTILLQSGIGPKNDLKKLNIPVFRDIAGVGLNLQNHVAYDLYFKVKNQKKQSILNVENIVKYTVNNTGPLASTGLSQVTAVLCADQTKKCKVPDIQLFFRGELDLNVDKTKDEVKVFGISAVVLHPQSRGSITLRPNGTYNYPHIKANYLTKQFDRDMLLKAIRIAQKLANATALKDKYDLEPIINEIKPCTDKGFVYDSDQYWQCAISYYTGPENHQAGSCKMGSINDKMTVVINDLRVRDVRGLRVVDASVIPVLVSGNTHAAVVMIAEKTADLIKMYYKK